MEGSRSPGVASPPSNTSRPIFPLLVAQMGRPLGHDQEFNQNAFTFLRGTDSFMRRSSRWRDSDQAPLIGGGGRRV